MPIILTDVEQTEPWDYLQLGLFLDISYKGFFLQTNQRRSIALLGATEFGYQLVVKESWQLDFIAKAYVQGYDSELLIEYSDADEDILGGLRERDPTLGVALRYSQYFKDALFTIDFAHTHSGDDENGKSINGYIIDSFYSHLLLYRNWDIYLGAGLTYFSHDVVNNFIGISPSEATDIRAEYKANGGFRAQLEVYAQYPLSESWSFSTGITQSLFSSEIKESPIVDTNHTTQVALGVQYVF
jgi:outer membrane scaffolding protein for murein synthesis (MipA/OmpV family)